MEDSSGNLHLVGQERLRLYWTPLQLSCGSLLGTVTFSAVIFLHLGLVSSWSIGALSLRNSSARPYGEEMKVTYLHSPTHPFPKLQTLFTFLGLLHPWSQTRSQNSVLWHNFSLPDPTHTLLHSQVYLGSYNHDPSLVSLTGASTSKVCACRHILYFSTASCIHTTYATNTRSAYAQISSQEQ